MKHVRILFGILLVAAAGCQKPDPVVVDTGDPTERIVEVTPFAAPDTDQTFTSVDTTGLTPVDAVSFAAFLLVGNVEYDAGVAGTQSASFSTVYFADRTRPLQANGKTYGFYGMDLSPVLTQPVTINDMPMVRIPHRLRFPGALRDTTWGFVYVKDLAGIHQPNAAFTWRVPAPMNVGSFNASIMTPDNVQILAPAGGSVVPRNKDLVMRWVGKGDLNVVISVLNPLTKKTRPILKLRPRYNTGSAIIDTRILQLLPRERFFVFTFIIANRSERLVVGQYTGLILIQAASVHNSYVELQ